MNQVKDVSLEVVLKRRKYLENEISNENKKIKSSTDLKVNLKLVKVACDKFERL